MQTPSYKELLEAGCHFGHMTRKWNPKMREFIFMERKGIHVIDLNRTAERLEELGKVVRSMAKAGKKILFVGTKKQAREIVKKAAESVGMPFVVDRWLGGMMTNFPTIRRSIKKMQSLHKNLNDGTLENVTKKERLMLTRKYEKLQRVFGGIAQLTRLPNAVFVIDIQHEDIALQESKRLGIKTLGIVDTNSDPNAVDFSVPANDDASKSIALITNYIAAAIREGLEDRRREKEEKESIKDVEAPEAEDKEPSAES